MRITRPSCRADRLRVPAAAAGRAGAVQRSNRSAAETAALLALMQGRRPGRSRGGSGCRRGAARTPGRDAWLGTIGDGDPVGGRRERFETGYKAANDPLSSIKDNPPACRYIPGSHISPGGC